METTLTPKLPEPVPATSPAAEQTALQEAAPPVASCPYHWQPETFTDRELLASMEGTDPDPGGWGLEGEERWVTTTDHLTWLAHELEELAHNAGLLEPGSPVTYTVAALARAARAAAGG